MLFLVCLLPMVIAAANVEFSVASIPDELKKDANAVIRKNVSEFTIEGISDAVLRVHYVVTILNQKAAEMAEIAIHYDKSTQVYGPHLKIMDALGNDITSKIKRTGIKDESAIGDASLYEDDRVKIISPDIPYYPVTIEYKYEVFYSGVIFDSYPRWMPVGRYNTSLEYASLRIHTPKDLRPRSKECNIPECSVIPVGTNRLTLEWTLDAFSAIVKEPFSPPFYEIVPYVMVSPSQLKAGDYRGEFKAWDDFARFIGHLGEGRQALPQSTVAKLQEMVKDCSDDLCKIRKLYQYMQGRTRYVSIQVGLGGWQPSPAEFVDKKGYGDCKGLVNYMQSILQAVGVRSYYTLVHAGIDANPIFSDFPGNQFNHIILCISLSNDSLWLECTSPHQPFGYLGSFTHNRDVLLISGSGGKLVHTPAYGLMDNITRRSITCTLNNLGDANIKADIYESGISAENTQDIYYESQEEQYKLLKKQSGLADCDILKLSYSLDGEQLPVTRTGMELSIRGYAVKSNNRSFVPAIVLGRFNEVPQGIGERKYPVVIRNAFSESDSIQIMLPENTEPEFFPEGLNEHTPFGIYSLHATKEGKTLLIHRSFQLYSDRYPPESYKEFQAFLRKVAKHDQTKIVIRSTN